MTIACLFVVTPPFPMSYQRPGSNEESGVRRGIDHPDPENGKGRAALLGKPHGGSTGRTAVRAKDGANNTSVVEQIDTITRVRLRWSYQRFVFLVLVYLTISGKQSREFDSRSFAPFRVAFFFLSLSPEDWFALYKLFLLKRATSTQSYFVGGGASSKL